MLNPALLQQHALSVTTVDRLILSTDYPFQHPTAERVVIVVCGDVGGWVPGAVAPRGLRLPTLQ